ncbi:MAG TPA: fumarylacetoacetate hydrolase family protein [Ktedonobacterales bacterium]|nr:fumarylacetoacetate hydrolase family protein [Ktedonobacterales bacterium]
MRIVTFAIAEEARLGAVVGDLVVDLPGSYAAWRRSQAMAGESEAQFAALPATALDLLRAGEPALAVARQMAAYWSAPEQSDALRRVGLAYPADAVTFLPPILTPGKIICLGQNYRKHIEEMGHEQPKFPVLFAKFPNVLVGHRQQIVLPTVSQKVDYEAELAVVIGRTGKHIAHENAFEYIAGYTCFNDVSVRDYQTRTSEWLQGKSFDTCGPLGPALVTADEISNPPALDIMTRLNGEVMQHSNTSDLFFDIPTVINYISQIMTLEPGDVIATGTPGGVGVARNPQVFLKAGDVVQVEIASLGVLENSVIAG